jgi:hypothetical protein
MSGAPSGCGDVGATTQRRLPPGAVNTRKGNAAVQHPKDPHTQDLQALSAQLIIITTIVPDATKFSELSEKSLAPAKATTRLEKKCRRGVFSGRCAGDLSVDLL